MFLGIFVFAQHGYGQLVFREQAECYRPPPAVESLADTPSRIRFSVFMRTYSVPAAAAAAATYIGEEDLLLRVLGSELFGL